MVQHPEPDNLPAPDALRDLPLWARRYAANRSLGMVVSLLAFAAGYLIIGGLTYLVVLAGRAHSLPLMVLSTAALLSFVGLWVWLCFGGMTPLLTRTTAWLYRREGEVSLGSATACPAAERRQGLRAALVVGLPLLALVVVAVHMPPRYLQPLTALWVVPFLVWLGVRQRRQMTPIILLWPALYALHAALVLAGAPIQFSGSLQGLDVLLPVLGYGLLTGLIAHLYSRYALRRLRRLGREEAP